MAEDEIVLTVRLSPELHERLKHAAEESHRSMAATVRVLIERGCPAVKA